MHAYVQAAITILSLINPVICAAIFNELEKDNSAHSGLKDATRAALAIFVILTVTALIGVRVLDIFGISLPAFQVAGGIVLVWMGFSMLRGANTHRKSQQPTGTESSRLIPLILFAASPGTISGVITLAATHTGTALPVTALVGVTAAVLLTWFLLLVTSSSSNKSNTNSLFHDVTTRFMGLIVLAMGVQFALTGYQSVLASS